MNKANNLVTLKPKIPYEAKNIVNLIVSVEKVVKDVKLICIS